MMQGRWSTVGSTMRLYILFPVYIKHSPFPFSLYHSRKQNWAFTLNGTAVFTCTDYLNYNFLMHLNFIFRKNVSFSQDLKYNIHLHALWEGHWENELEAAKEQISPSFFFSSLFSYCRENRMKAICLWYMLVQSGKGYSTNATLHLTIRHLNHHDENLKSCKGNSPSSGQVLLLSEMNGWRFVLILLHGLQPQQQNSALQFRLTNEEYAATILLPNLAENHYLRLTILILWSLSGLVNKGFLTYIPSSFSRALCTQSLRELSKQRLLLWT